MRVISRHMNSHESQEFSGALQSATPPRTRPPRRARRASSSARSARAFATSATAAAAGTRSEPPCAIEAAIAPVRHGCDASHSHSPVSRATALTPASLHVIHTGADLSASIPSSSLLSSAIALSAVSAHILKVLLVLGRVEGEGEGGGEQGEGGGDEHQLRRQRQGLRGARAPLDLAAGGRQERVRLQARQEVSGEWSSETVISDRL